MKTIWGNTEYVIYNMGTMIWERFIIGCSVNLSQKTYQIFKLKLEYQAKDIKFRVDV